MKHQVLNFKVAFCAIFFMCSSLSQSINVNNKQAVHTNKKSHSNGLALLPDADLTIDQEEDDDDDDEDDLKSESDYSNEYDQGSSGLDTFGHTDEFDRTLPFFQKVPENAYIMKNRQAVLKCKAINALDVSSMLAYLLVIFLNHTITISFSIVTLLLLHVTTTKMTTTTKTNMN